MQTKLFSAFVIILISVLFATATTAETPLPEVSHDGLHLMKDTKLRAVYVKPGANLKEYDKIALLACYVAFAKNWQRDFNRDATGLEDRITDKEMKKIRDGMAREFNKIFTQVLSTEGGHQLVKSGGTGVLIIRPAIINLRVTAPDQMTAGISRTVATDAGQMTLYMELYDGKTGDIIVRAIDPKEAGTGFAQIRNIVTNTADADRVLRRWARLLNKQLADVHAATGS